MPVKDTLLFVGNFLPVPRYNKNVWHFLAEKLAETGWSVVTTSDKEQKLTRLLDMLHTIWKKRRAYQVAHIDVFSGKAFIYTILSAFLLKRLRKTTVLTLHGGGLPEFAAKYPGFCRKVLTSADRVVTPSAYLQKAFSDIRADIILIPNPINLQESIYRERTSVVPSLIWVRAFHAVYNPSMAVRVLYLLSADYPHITLSMLGPDKGDGSLAAALQLAETLGVRPKLQIVGHVTHEKVPRWLDQADFFINTSNYDTAPRSLLESMANGLCVISTNVGGIPLMAAEGSEALLVNPDDAQAMAAAIAKVLRDPVLANSLSRNARQRAEQSDWSAILPKWDALFSSLVHKNS